VTLWAEISVGRPTAAPRLVGGLGFGDAINCQLTRASVSSEFRFSLESDEETISASRGPRNEDPLESPGLQVRSRVSPCRTGQQHTAQPLGGTQPQRPYPSVEERDGRNVFPLVMHGPGLKRATIPVPACAAPIPGNAVHSDRTPDTGSTVGFGPHAPRMCAARSAWKRASSSIDNDHGKHCDRLVLRNGWDVVRRWLRGAAAVRMD